MPSSFPFLRLPILIQLLILKNSSLLDLFYLSLTSKHSKQIVKSQNITLAKLEWGFDNTSKFFNRKLTPSNGSRLYICTKTYQEVPVGSIHFNDKVLSVSHAEYNCQYRLAVQNELSDNDRLELMDQLTKHFSDLFKVTEYHLHSSDLPDFFACFVWKYTKKLANLRITNQRSNPLTSDEMQFILNELIVTDKLFLLSFVEDGFKYAGQLKMKKLHVRKADWLELEAILNMECEYLRIYRSPFTYKDINTIVKKWLDLGSEGLKNLMDFKIQVPDPDPAISNDSKLDFALEGIETFPWDSNNRPAIIRNYDCRHGRDFRRSDGLGATVSYVRDGFAFHIWQPFWVSQ